MPLFHRNAGQPPQIFAKDRDRFLHHATIVTITGESYWLKDAALAQSKPKE